MGKAKKEKQESSNKRRKSRKDKNIRIKFRVGGCFDNFDHPGAFSKFYILNCP